MAKKSSSTRLKETLYAVFSLSEDTIRAAEERFAQLNKDEVKALAQRWCFDGLTSDGYQPVFSDENKIMLINAMVHGTLSERKKIAQEFNYQSSYLCGRLYQLGMFDLFYTWATQLNNKKLLEQLSPGILKYMNDERAWLYYEAHRDDEDFHLHALASLHGPAYLNLFRYRDKYLALWKHVADKFQTDGWGSHLLVEKNLGLYSPEPGYFSLHSVETPWNYSDAPIRKLQQLGVDIQLDGEIGDHYHQSKSEMLVGLVLNGQRFDRLFCGPFLPNPENTRLYCSLSDPYFGLMLVEIDLNTNETFYIDSSPTINVPIAYEHDGEKLTAYDCWNNLNLALDKQKAKYYYIPERLRSEPFKAQFKQLAATQAPGFEFEKGAIISVRNWHHGFPDDYYLKFILGTFNLPKTYPLRICLCTDSGEIFALYHCDTERQYYQFVVSRNLNDFIESIQVYQSFMTEEGFASSPHAETAQLSADQVSKLRSRLAPFLPTEPTERNFWLWLLSR